MAIYYMNVQIIGRSAGRSATGAAAYRAGERIHDERTGVTYDYTRRRGDIETEILAPAGAPEWATDRAQLWNAVEKAERRGDAQLCREIVVALPVELDREQQRELVRAYVQDQFVTRGMVADVAIHQNPGNPHAHIMLTMREMGPEGLSAKKNRDWNKPEILEQWRERWAVESNRALERAGREERVDHRSLAEQGSDRLPQVHLGPHAHALEKRGQATEKGEHNRAVAEHNAVVIDLQKAREEKKQLEVERVVTERYKARLQKGWSSEHAQALGRLEYAQGGGAITWRQAEEMKTGLSRQLDDFERQVRAVEQEGRRLEQAERILAERKQAAEKVERMQSPVAKVQRWFSAGARTEYQQARAELDRKHTEAIRVGTASSADFNEQRARWKIDKAQMPGLEAKVAGLSESLTQVLKVLEGFRSEFDREQWDLHRRRERSRDDDRGR